MSTEVRIPSLRIVAALCSCVIVLASCGGNGSNGSSGISKADFRSQADAICKRHTDPIRAAASKLLAGGNLPSPKKFKKLAVGTIIPEFTAEVHELRALTPPSDLAKSYTKWVDESETVSQKMMQDPTVITNSANFQTVNDDADSLGLSSDCHVGPG